MSEYLIEKFHERQLLIDNPEMANEIEVKIREKLKEMQAS